VGMVRTVRSLLTLAASCLAQEHPHRNGEKLGTVHFATQCNEVAHKGELRREKLLPSSCKRRRTKPLGFLLCYFRDQEVEGSNPFAPTILSTALISTCAATTSASSLARTCLDFSIQRPFLC
jgi:hypothetical protein